MQENCQCTKTNLDACGLQEPKLMHVL